jgi:nitroreductase
MDLTVDELLTTTRTVRRRLDLDRPVERDIVDDCLRTAFQAPTGSNQQDWGWVLVDDAATRRAMADLYRQGLVDHQQRDASHQVAAGPITAGSDMGERGTGGAERMGRSVAYLLEHMQDVPVLLVPTIGVRYGSETAFARASQWGSILPAVWNFMLALRTHGMGSAWTTLHLYREREMAELLGIPHDEQTQVGLFPVAYTLGTEFRRADRDASEQRIFWNRWGQSH